MNIIEELQAMLIKMPFINVIEFFDDDFICTNPETISEFAELYKKHINLPFRCNFRPDSVTEEKISILVDAGLISAEMGLQSASKRTNKLYKRHFNKKKFLEAANIINKHEEISAHYDLIVDNPMENNDDLQETLRFLAELPVPFQLPTYSLTFFPGTQLYKFARENNLFRNEEKDIFNKKNYVVYEYKQPYIKFLFIYIRLVGCKQPIKKSIFLFLTSKIALTVFGSKLFNGFWITIIFAKRVFSKLKDKDVQLVPG